MRKVNTARKEKKETTFFVLSQGFQRDIRTALMLHDWDVWKNADLIKMRFFGSNQKFPPGLGFLSANPTSYHLCGKEK